MKAVQPLASRTVVWILGFFLLLSIPGLVESAVGVALLPTGAAAPAFEAVDIDGRHFELEKELSKGPVFLVFWSIFCGPCREELPILESEKEKYADQKVQFATVNLDEPPRAKVVKGFADQQGFTFRILLNKTEEKNYEVDKLYQVKGTPASYLIDLGGTIVFSKYGPVSPQELHEAIEKLPAN